jgi:hypothetical protein
MKKAKFIFRRNGKMDVIQTIKCIPNVQIENVAWEKILNKPLDFIQKNITSTYLPLASYKVYKGKHKGNQIILFIDWDKDQLIPVYGVREVGTPHSSEISGTTEHGFFQSIEEAAEKFKHISMRYELQTVYRVYQAKLKGEDEIIRFSVSELREISFRKEVEEGRFLIDLDSLVLLKETEDRNEARALATEF